MFLYFAPRRAYWKLMFSTNSLQVDDLVAGYVTVLRSQSALSCTVVDVVRWCIRVMPWKIYK